MDVEIDLTEYLEFESFIHAFKHRGNSPALILQAAGMSIEKLNTNALINLNHKLYGLWPHNRQKDILVLGVKRGIQNRYYEQLYDKKPSQNVSDLDNKIRKLLDLRQERHEIIMEVETAGKVIKKKYKSEFSKKIGEMSLDAIANWARELGVSNDKIEKHLAKPIGLAKMNLSNLIRAKL